MNVVAPGTVYAAAPAPVIGMALMWAGKVPLLVTITFWRANEPAATVTPWKSVVGVTDSVRVPAIDFNGTDTVSPLLARMVIIALRGPGAEPGAGAKRKPRSTISVGCTRNGRTGHGRAGSRMKSAASGPL